MFRFLDVTALQRIRCPVPQFDFDSICQFMRPNSTIWLSIDAERNVCRTTGSTSKLSCKFCSISCFKMWQHEWQTYNVAHMFLLTLIFLVLSFSRSRIFSEWPKKSSVCLLPLDSCIVDGHVTRQKLLRIALKQRQTLL